MINIKSFLAAIQSISIHMIINENSAVTDMIAKFSGSLEDLYFESEKSVQNSQKKSDKKEQRQTYKRIKLFYKFSTFSVSVLVFHRNIQ